MADRKLGEVVLKDVRLSFPHIWKKQAATEDATPKFSAAFLMDPSTPAGKKNVKSCEKAIADVMKEKWKKEVRLKPGREGMQDGDEQISDNTGEVYDGYEGMMVVSAKNGNRIPIVDADKTTLAEEDGKPYAGCYVNAVIRFFAVDDAKKGGKGIFASLEAIQFKRDGEAFGAAPVDVDDYFDEEGFDDDEDGDDLV